MLRARHSPLVAVGVWILTVAFAILAKATVPLRTTQAPHTETIVLGALEGPEIPVEWIRKLQLIEDLAPAEFRPLVIETAERYGFDPRLLASVAWMETGGTWRPDLIGADGEIGLMQILPSTAAWISQTRGEELPDLADPVFNLDYGAWYIARLMEGATASVLAEYNAGPDWRNRAPTAAREYSRRVLELHGAAQSEWPGPSK